MLVGHDHDYERFALQDPEGALDPVDGIRQFVVGTGGKSFHNWGAIQPGSEARNNDTFGVLKLVLSPDELRVALHPGGREDLHGYRQHALRCLVVPLPHPLAI